MKKKVFILLGIIIIAVIIGIFVSMYINDKSKYDFEIERVTEINYNILYKDNKYGVINRNGDVIVEPIYNIVQIPNPSKDVFICMGEYNSEQKEYEVKVLNANGEELYQDYEISLGSK